MTAAESAIVALFGLPGAGLLVGGLAVLGRRLRFVLLAERADGVVVGVHSRAAIGRPSGDPLGERFHFPTVRFTTRDGRSITFRSSTGDHGRVSAYQVGQPVRVIYDPAGAMAPMLDGFWGVWFGGVALTVAGVVVLAVAILIGASFS